MVALHGAYSVPVRVVVWTVFLRTVRVGRHRLLRVVSEELEDDVHVWTVGTVGCVERRRRVVTSRMLLMLLTMWLSDSVHLDVTRCTSTSLLRIHLLCPQHKPSHMFLKTCTVIKVITSSHSVRPSQNNDVFFIF